MKSMRPAIRRNVTCSVWLATWLALSAGCATSREPPPLPPPPTVVECPRLPPVPPEAMEPIRSDYLSRTEKLYTELLRKLMPLLCAPGSSSSGSAPSPPPAPSR